MAVNKTAGVTKMKVGSVSKEASVIKKAVPTTKPSPMSKKAKPQPLLPRKSQSKRPCPKKWLAPS